MGEHDVRQRLIQAATEAFFQCGYRAGVDDIARRAGVAKQTLYNHFESKQRLFAAVVREATRPIVDRLDQPELPLRQRLVEFVQALRQRAFSDESVALQRLITAEAPRFPEEAQAVFDAGVGLACERLSEAFAQASERREVVVPCPTATAEAFLSLVLGFDWMRSLYGVPTPQSSVQDKAERLVDCFLRSFAPPPAGN